MLSNTLALQRVAARWLRTVHPLGLWRRLPATEPLRNVAYRRLWSSALVGGLGLHLMALTLPLAAAVLLQATPAQMGLLVACGVLPLALLALPAGVWLDRVRKLPVYMGGELLLAAAALSVPLAAWAGVLGMPWLYGVALVMGVVDTVGTSAQQIVLTQTVPRQHLVQAHARHVQATSGAELLGPGLAGALMKLAGAPLAMGLHALLLLGSVGILRGLKLQEPAPEPSLRPWPALCEGLRFVASTPVLVALALAVSLWQFAYHMVLVAQVLFATRTLGLDEGQVALSFTAVGIGTLAAGILSQRLSSAIGPGRAMGVGAAVNGLGWLAMAAVPAGADSLLLLTAALALYGVGTSMVFVGFFALRQAVTPAPMMGRMTSVMRWVTLLPGAPGALLGGWASEALGLRATLAFAGAIALLSALLYASLPTLRRLRTLPQPTGGAA